MCSHCAKRWGADRFITPTRGGRRRRAPLGAKATVGVAKAPRGPATPTRRGRDPPGSVAAETPASVAARPHRARASCYLPPPRGCGEIGRRARFRSVWGKPLGGSSPLSRIGSGRRGAPRLPEAAALRHGGRPRRARRHPAPQTKPATASPSPRPPARPRRGCAHRASASPRTGGCGRSRRRGTARRPTPPPSRTAETPRAPHARVG